jgi:hypothetical protein
LGLGRFVGDSRLGFVGVKHILDRASLSPFSADVALPGLKLILSQHIGTFCASANPV